MNHETMTVHKALAELKTLDARISKAIRQGIYVTCNRHSNQKIGGVNIAAYCDEMKSHYDSVAAMILRRNALKRAVVLSNARTEVEIAGQKYTVAEAIDMKNHGLDGDVLLVSTMEAQFASAQQEIERNSGEALQSKAESYVTGLYGGKDKVNGDEAKEQMKAYIAANTYDLVDPLNIKETMKAINDHVSAFMAEVDGALSVSNALTNIEISY